MKKIILRADDLGYSKGTNYGIEESVKVGLVRNVGVMVNLPNSQDGVNLLKGKKVSLVYTRI